MGEKRFSLSNESLDDLLILTTDAIPLKMFNLDASIELWWKDKVRHPNQQPRKTSEKMADQSSTMVDLTGGDEVKEMDSQLTLDDWDQWINPRSDDDPIVLRNYSLRFSLLFIISNKEMWIIHSTAEVVSLLVLLYLAHAYLRAHNLI